MKHTEMQVGSYYVMKTCAESHIAYIIKLMGKKGENTPYVRYEGDFKLPNFSTSPKFGIEQCSYIIPATPDDIAWLDRCIETSRVCFRMQAVSENYEVF